MVGPSTVRQQAVHRPDPNSDSHGTLLRDAISRNHNSTFAFTARKAYFTDRPSLSATLPAAVRKDHGGGAGGAIAPATAGNLNPLIEFDCT